MTEEIQRICATCSNDDNHTGNLCGVRGECFTPDYDHWMERGTEQEQQPGIKELLGLKLNCFLVVSTGRYIRVPGGWIFETEYDKVCFIPEPK